MRNLIAITMSLVVASQALGQRSRQQQFRFTEAEIQSLVPDPILLRQVQVDPAVRELVDELGSDSFADREAAMSELMEGGHPNQRLQLYAMLERRQLDSEQKFRVLEIIRQRLVDAPSGALGISMRTRGVAAPGDPIEIEVINLVPGLPAERVLQLRDRIFEIDGQALMTQDDLVRRVQAKRPGDDVRLAIRRARRDELGALLLDADRRATYEELIIDMPLGSAADLADPNGGGNVFRSSVISQREWEAQVAAERYSPQPDPIEVRTGFEGSFSAGPDLLSPEMIDRHPSIEGLRSSLRYIESGNLQVTDRLRRQWRKQLANLRQQAAHPGFTTSERSFMRAVADRFEELVEGR